MLDGHGVFPLAILQTYATSAIQIRKKNSGFLAAVTITRTRGPLGSPDALRRAINLVALIVSSGHSDIVSSGHSDPRRGTHRLLQPERILPVASAQPVTEYTLPRPLCRQGTVRQTRDTTRRISSLQTNESGTSRHQHQVSGPLPFSESGIRHDHSASRHHHQAAGASFTQCS